MPALDRHDKPGAGGQCLSSLHSIKQTVVYHGKAVFSGQASRWESSPGTNGLSSEEISGLANGNLDCLDWRKAGGQPVSGFSEGGFVSIGFHTFIVHPALPRVKAKKKRLTRSAATRKSQGKNPFRKITGRKQPPDGGAEDLMARAIRMEPSRTLKEFRLLPGLTTRENTIDRIDLSTPLAGAGSDVPGIGLNLPLVASAMQSVSGPEMAIELARLGGLAFIYCSQSAADQAAMVKQVKAHKAGFVEPRTVTPEMQIEGIHRMSLETGYSTFPVVDAKGTFLGLLTRRDFDPYKHAELTVHERMVPKKMLEVGVNITDLSQANALLIAGHQSALPVLDDNDRLLHLVFRKDIHDKLDYPLQVVDGKKRLLVGAALNTHDFRERADLVVAAGADVLCIDSSDGHSVFQREALQWLTEHHPGIPVVGGNIITASGFRFLAESGARAVKVGMGGGSICITQEQKGTGRGLASAVRDVVEERDRYFQESGAYVPVIADGGIVNSKDVTIALALGADCVMMGRFFARMEESPTEKVQVNNRVMKPYWGEGSAKARDWQSLRYSQSMFVEGVEGFVEYAGKLRDNLERMLAKIKASMSSCGSANLASFHRNAELELVSALSIREGQVHDLEQFSVEEDV